MREGQKAAPSADLDRIKSFLAAAFTDYIAARVLLNNSLPLQGAIQASTALEKYLKAFLAFRGDKNAHGHLQRGQMNALRNFAPQLWATLNEEFFLLCQKVYDLRYPESLAPGFNAVIADREFLAELDDTAIALHGTFMLHDTEGQQQLTAMETYIDRKDPRLVFNNHVLFRMDKQEFISTAPQYVYECRLIPEEGGLVEMEYLAHPRRSDGHFLREALRKSGARSALTAFKLFRPDELDNEPEHESSLSEEAEHATEILSGKALAGVVRNRPEEVLIEFVDGTRLYAGSSQPLELTITEGVSESSASEPAG